MRAAHLTETARTLSNAELAELANNFIKQGFEAHIEPTWLNDDGSYDWKAAKDAHLADLPVSRFQKMDRKTERLLSKIHHFIWLRLEDERLEAVIAQLESRRAELRNKLVAVDLYSSAKNLSASDVAD